MAQIFNTPALMNCLLLLLVSFIAASHSVCNIPSEFWCDDADVANLCGVFEQCQRKLTPQAGDAALVQIGLYYESQCIACSEFIQGGVLDAFQKVPHIWNLTLVPYGNAREEKVGDKWVFECQHGPPECLGNIIETCAINLIKDATVYVPFIVCMEKLAIAFNPWRAAHECAKPNSIPLDTILTCAKSNDGNRMEHEMAMRTPQHRYVPWVTLNGIHTEDIQEHAQSDLVGLICETYTGPVKPAACSKKTKGLKK